MKRVYLAGPIAGLSYDAAACMWRKKAFEELNRYGIAAYSPMRAKGFLAKVSGILSSTIPPHAIDGSQYTSAKGIVGRDRFDVQNCDVVLVNLLNAPRVSIGTMVEFGWANAWDKPIVTVMEENDPYHDHLFVHQLSTYVTPTLDTGLEMVKNMLIPAY